MRQIFEPSHNLGPNLFLLDVNNFGLLCQKFGAVGPIFRPIMPNSGTAKQQQRSSPKNLGLWDFWCLTQGGLRPPLPPTLVRLCEQVNPASNSFFTWIYKRNTGTLATSRDRESCVSISAEYALILSILRADEYLSNWQKNTQKMLHISSIKQRTELKSRKYIHYSILRRYKH